MKSSVRYNGFASEHSGGWASKPLCWTTPIRLEDTFGGSGSTLMACEQMNRICYMMELDEKYASVILRRYVEDTGNAEGVYVIRDGQQIPYSDLVKEVETKES